jgi:hypothetical protein
MNMFQNKILSIAVLPLLTGIGSASLLIEEGLHDKKAAIFAGACYVEGVTAGCRLATSLEGSLCSAAQADNLITDCSKSPRTDKHLCFEVYSSEPVPFPPNCKEIGVTRCAPVLQSLKCMVRYVTKNGKVAAEYYWNGSMSHGPASDNCGTYATGVKLWYANQSEPPDPPAPPPPPTFPIPNVQCNPLPPME